MIGAGPESRHVGAAIVGLLTEGAADSTIDVTQPLLSWSYASPSLGAPLAARVVVASTAEAAERLDADVWDSGERPALPARMEYAGPSFTSRATYWWRVGARLDDQEWVWSAPARLRTGIIAPDAWAAAWIGRADAPERLLALPAGQSIEVPTGGAATREFAFHSPIGMLSADVSPLTPGTRGRLELIRTEGAAEGEPVASWELDDSWGRYFSWWGHLERPLEPGAYALRLRVSAGAASWSLDETGQPCISVAAAQQPAFVLRREIELDRPARSATIYATGLGYHRITLDGNPVDEAVLDPAVTDYSRRVLYNRVELGALRPGRSVLEIALGHGYFATTGANIWGWHAAPWNDDPIAIAELHVEFADGGPDLVVGTDETWTVHPSPVRRDSLYEGETWELDVATDSVESVPPGRAARVVAGPAGALRIQPQPRMIAETVADVPVRLADSPGESLIDLGRTITGWITLSCTARPHSEIEIAYGELLEDARVGVRNPFIDGRPQVDRIRVGADGRVSEWSPQYSYKGFRFVRIRGEGLRIGAVAGVEVHSDIRSAGVFASGIPVVDWIDAATRRTLLNNLQGIPTDTPVHEKNGWTGDGHLIARTAMYQFDMATFYRKWLDDFRDAQDATGAVPVIVPTPGWGRIVCPVFSGAYPILVWDHFVHYGDRRVLAENLDGVAGYARHLITELSRTGVWEGYSWGDWMSPGNDYAPEGPALAATAFCLEAIRRVGWIAGELGRDGLADEMRAEFAAFRDAFIERFFESRESRFRTDAGEDYRQGSNVLALAFDLVPEAAHDAVVERLVHDIEVTRNGHLNTGAPSTRSLLPVLSAAGRDDVAVDLLLQTTQPSWGFWHGRGGDTLWEKWGLEARSRNHYFFGTVSQWIRERVGGLAIAAPGGSVLDFDPVVDDRIRSGSCSVATIHGAAAAEWRREDDRLVARLDLPNGCSARVADRFLVGPAAGSTLGPGRHALELGVRPALLDPTQRKDHP